MATATLIAGIPTHNLTLYHQTRFIVHDPAALIIEHKNNNSKHTTLMVRSLELDRAKKNAKVDEVAWPGNFEPQEGFDADRELHTPQGVAQMLLEKKITNVTVDRNLPAVFWYCLEKAGIEVTCNPMEGMDARRIKDEEELAALEEAQAATERAMKLACELIANASVNKDGSLQYDGCILTSERVQHAIDLSLLKEGYENPGSIVAGGPQGSDCHESGSGPLFTSQPVIIDIFPKSKKTLYNGDCTRTVVNGAIPDAIQKMHSAVLEAKAKAIKMLRPGVTGNDVHNETLKILINHGYNTGMRPEDAPSSWCGMVHGTGHGIGLEVHEPPSVGKGGSELLIGDVVTIEPGLYCQDLGGIRIEDMVTIVESGYRNFNSLPENLDWKT